MVIKVRYPFQDDLPLAGVPAPESGHEQMGTSMVDARRSGRAAREASAKLASTSRARAHCVNFIHELQAYRNLILSIPPQHLLRESLFSENATCLITAWVCLRLRNGSVTIQK